MKTFVVTGNHNGKPSSHEFQAESLDQLSDVISESHLGCPVEIKDGQVRIVRVMFEGTVREKRTPVEEAVLNVAEAVDQVVVHLEVNRGHNPLLVEKARRLALLKSQLLSVIFTQP